MKRLNLFLAICLVVCLFVSSTVYASNESIQQETEFNSVPEIGFYELVKEINSESGKIDSDEIGIYIDEISKTIQNISSDELVAIVLDSDSSYELKEILLSASVVSNKSLNNEELIKLIEDENVEYEIKRLILMNLYICCADTASIEKIALGNDERLAFHAMLNLYNLSPQKAITIADNVINVFDGEIGYKDKAALKIRALSLKENSTNQEKTAFINLCDGILKDDVKDDEMAINTVAYVLSDVMCEESIEYIIDSDVMSESLKAYCVKKNAEVFEKMCEKTINNDDKILATKAMNLYEISEVVDTLDIEIEEQDNTMSANQMTRDISTTSTTSTTSTLPMTGKGYAVYRVLTQNSSSITTELHAGIMNTGAIDGTFNPIIHSTPNGLVRFTYEDDFLNGKSFIGYFRPKTQLTMSTRNLVIDTAKELIWADVANMETSQMLVLNANVTNSIIQPTDIQAISSEGVVEYSYEYNGIKISGGTGVWDISTNSAANRAAHVGINALTQARDNMINLLGDVNSDYSVNATDANLVLRYASKLEEFNSFQVFVGDVNGDGVVNAVDANLILNYAAKNISKFPADPF